MTLEEAKVELEKFVKLKTTMRPAFVQPLLDAVEVVRCKDCKYYWKNSVMTNVPLCLASPREDAFCSDGEREEDETD